MVSLLKIFMIDATTRELLLLYSKMIEIADSEGTPQSIGTVPVMTKPIPKPFYSV